MKMMRGRRLIAAIAALILVMGIAAVFAFVRKHGPVPSGEPTPRPQGEGWIDLLDAAHAPGWKNMLDDKDIFEIKDGMLHIFGRTIYPLRYATYAAERFGDFDLHVEFKLTRHANSGVFVRAQPNDPVNRGFEVQVLEDCGKPPDKNSCGSIYDVVTPMFNMSRPAGEWNSFDISMNGNGVVVAMNGWMVIHTDLSKMTTPLGKYTIPFAQLSREGNLAVQDHGGEVWYRNILIRPLQAQRPN